VDRDVGCSRFITFISKLAEWTEILDADCFGTFICGGAEFRLVDKPGFERKSSKWMGILGADSFIKDGVARRLVDDSGFIERAKIFLK